MIVPGSRFPFHRLPLLMLLKERAAKFSIFDFVIVMGIFFFLPIHLFSVFYFNDLLLFFFALVLVPYCIKEFKKFYFTKEHALVFLFASWSFFAYLNTPWKDGGLLLCWSMYLMPGILFLSLSQVIFFGQKSKALGNGWIVWGLLIAGQLMYTLVSDPYHLNFELHYKANIYWARSNYIAAMLEFPILWCFHQMHQKNSSRIPAAISFIVCLFALFLTVSRGGIITIVLAIFIYSVLSKKLYSIFIFGVIAVFFLPHYSSRFKDLLDIGNVDRIYLWIQSIDLIKKNPIFGYGPGDVQLYVGPFSKSDMMSDPHNFILTILLHTGCIGMLFFALLMIIFFSRALLVYKRQKNPFFIVCMFSAFLHGMVEPTFIGYSYSFLFWYCMVMLLIQSEQLKSISAKKNSNGLSDRTKPMDSIHS
jgi:O-antigen ligase